VRYRDRLPQLTDGPFLADAGMETTLVFEHRIDLPCFAAFPLLETETGTDTIRGYFEPFLELARRHRTGFVMDTLSWRANRDWGAQLGYSPDGLAEVNRRCVAFAEELRDEAGDVPVVVNGVIGPRGDAYRPEETMSAAEAERYHREQIETLSETSADMVTGLTLTNAEEAVGIARAAHSAGLPVAISFTVETDGLLPSGQPLEEAVRQVDTESDGTPAYFMVNCAHPTHFDHALPAEAPWLERLAGIRANASTKSHAELDDSEELDAGDPVDLAERYRRLQARLPNLAVIGGCCGTDIRHVTRIADALLD
jgi:S-methylmethionine-dependent homocysteine/selenocysteine methylase